MESVFYINLFMKTISGYERFATFTLGTDRKFATRLFGKLNGATKTDETAVLYIDFVEEREGLPVNLDMLSCSLDELTENTRIITKELFKKINLVEM